MFVPGILSATIESSDGEIVTHLLALDYGQPMAKQGLQPREQEGWRAFGGSRDDRNAGTGQAHLALARVGSYGTGGSANEEKHQGVIALTRHLSQHSKRTRIAACARPGRWTTRDRKTPCGERRRGE